MIKNSNENSDESGELYDLDFVKITWKSIKSVMIVSKSKMKEKNSFMILESQTKDVYTMFSELLSKVENYHQIEVKKRVDTTFSSKLLQLSNKLFNKFNIIKSFFHIENNTLSKNMVPFDLKKYIIHTIDQLSMAYSSNINISLDFDPCLPEMIRGDKPKFQQILSSLMDLALQMTDQGEISLKVNLDALLAISYEYLLSFTITVFKSTSPHSKVIISHLLFNSMQVGRKELKNDLIEREKSSQDISSKFTGIPHLQIGLVRDVVYKLIKFLEGNYKITSKDDNVVFQFTMPFGQNASKINDESPLTDEKGTYPNFVQMAECMICIVA